MKWYINWLGIRGVNLFVPHVFYYSVTGPRKEERLPVNVVAALYSKGSNQKWIEQTSSPVLEETDYHTVMTEYDCPYLRTVHMEKEGVSWYLFSNEGEETIETKVYIKELQDGKKPFWILLWNAHAESIVNCSENSLGQSVSQNDTSWIRLKLEHCEMKLLLLLDKANSECVMEKYWMESGDVKSMAKAFGGDWTERFEQYVSKDDPALLDKTANTDKNTVTYRYVYVIPEGRLHTGAGQFTVRGEEMAECMCNGTFAGVSFYGPHTFRIGHLLKREKMKFFCALPKMQ